MSDHGAAHHLREVVDRLKTKFVGRDEVIDLIALALVAGEHLFLLGQPGTAKSALIRQFAEGVRGRYFEYMLTRFTEPTEIFGPVDLARLRDGVVATVTSGMLPQAEFVFLDELFNANSAILNNLLTVLNERIYRPRGRSPSLAYVVAFFGLEPFARRRCVTGFVRPFSTALPSRQLGTRQAAPIVDGRLGLGARGLPVGRDFRRRFA